MSPKTKFVVIAVGLLAASAAAFVIGSAAVETIKVALILML